MKLFFTKMGVISILLASSVAVANDFELNQICDGQGNLNGDANILKDQFPILDCDSLSKSRGGNLDDINAIQDGVGVLLFSEMQGAGEETSIQKLRGDTLTNLIEQYSDPTKTAIEKAQEEGVVFTDKEKEQLNGSTDSNENLNVNIETLEDALVKVGSSLSDFDEDTKIVTGNIIYNGSNGKLTSEEQTALNIIKEITGSLNISNVTASADMPTFSQLKEIGGEFNLNAVQFDDTRNYFPTVETVSGNIIIDFTIFSENANVLPSVKSHNAAIFMLGDAFHDNATILSGLISGTLQKIAIDATTFDGTLNYLSNFTGTITQEASFSTNTFKGTTSILNKTTSIGSYINLYKQTFEAGVNAFNQLTNLSGNFNITESTFDGADSILLNSLSSFSGNLNINKSTINESITVANSATSVNGAYYLAELTIEDNVNIAPSLTTINSFATFGLNKIGKHADNSDLNINTLKNLTTVGRYLYVALNSPVSGTITTFPLSFDNITNVTSEPIQIDNNSGFDTFNFGANASNINVAQLSIINNQFETINVWNKNPSPALNRSSLIQIEGNPSLNNINFLLAASGNPNYSFGLFQIRSNNTTYNLNTGLDTVPSGSQATCILGTGLNAPASFSNMCN